MVDALLHHLSEEYAFDRPRDRRVALAIVCGPVRRFALATGELHRCLDEMDKPALLSLSTGTRLRCRVLVRRFAPGRPGPKWMMRTPGLLPPEFCQKLPQAS